MLKRLIGVVTVRDGWAVQSMGYRRYLPLGRPEIIAENFDRWFLDEILVVAIDRTARGLGPDFGLVERIGQRRIMTPLSYGGGVRTAEDAVRLVKLGADRIALDAAFRADPDACRRIRDAIGIQAVIRALPLEKGADGAINAYDHVARRTAPLDMAALRSGEPVFSEVMAIDRAGEGGRESFDTSLVEPFADSGLQVIAFGGVTGKAQVADLYARPEISAVAVGNSLSYREIANRGLVSFEEMHDTRTTSYGARTQGAREW